MSKSLNIEFEKGIQMISKYFPPSDESSRKPVMFHDIRVGVYLYNHGYSDDIVLAGLLHDTIEWSDITEQMLRDEFGDNIVKLILASTKDDTIQDKTQKTVELITRCISNGQDALIIKTADILDSFKWYEEQSNQGELGYCMRNANAIFEHKPESFQDKIFDELKKWQKKYIQLNDR